MKIKKIDVGIENFDSKAFDDLCDDIEENITADNLVINGGTLNYSGLTYYSEILLVAYNDEEEPVGYNSIVRDSNGLYIYQIAVKKSYHRNGIGTLMLREAIKIAEEEGASFVTAHVMDYNIASQTMFLHLGFKKVSEEVRKDGKVNGFYILNVKEIEPPKELPKNR